MTLRQAVSRQIGDPPVSTAAGIHAEALVGMIPGDMLGRHPGVRAQLLAARGMAELWSGRLDEAAAVLDSGVTAAAGSGAEHEHAECLGYLALVESLRGRLCRSADLAARAAATAAASGPHPPVTRPNPAAAVAMAVVHLERHQLREAHGLLRQADAVREVLRHVSDMLNTAEVASEMYISVNTVKTHLKSIYRKLAATHRREAVRRAQQLKLI